MYWIVKTASDGMSWQFEDIDTAFKFYEMTKKAGETASFPAAVFTSPGGKRND
jgi:hypothetical protein